MQLDAQCYQWTPAPLGGGFHFEFLIFLYIYKRIPVSCFWEMEYRGVAVSRIRIGAVQPSHGRTRFCIVDCS